MTIWEYIALAGLGLMVASGAIGMFVRVLAAERSPTRQHFDEAAVEARAAVQDFADFYKSCNRRNVEEIDRLRAALRAIAALKVADFKLLQDAQAIARDALALDEGEERSA